MGSQMPRRDLRDGSSWCTRGHATRASRPETHRAAVRVPGTEADGVADAMIEAQDYHTKTHRIVHPDGSVPRVLCAVFVRCPRLSLDADHLGVDKVIELV